MESPLSTKLSGLVVWKHECHLITVDWVALVTDTLALGKTYQIQAEEDAKLARQDGDEDAARSCEEDATKFRRWQKNLVPFGGVPYIPFLIRQRMTPLLVDHTNLAAYVERLLGEWSEPTETCSSVQFVLDADRPTPTLWGTRKIQQARRHTSKAFLSILATEEELQQRATELQSRFKSSEAQVTFEGNDPLPPHAPDAE